MSDWEDAPSAKDEWEDAPEGGFGSTLLGGLDAAATMFAGTPAQIAGGLAGASTLLSGQGLDKANEVLESVQKSNFGFGEYKPATEKGGEYAEKVSGWLEKPVELAGDLGEKLGGNTGRLAGELWTRSAMELIDPLVIGGVAAKGFKGRKPKTPELTSAQKIQAEQDTVDAAKASDAGWETAGEIPNLKATEGLDGQMDLFDIPESGRMPNPTEAVLGDWRIDENGMPIKADLSMDAQNAQAPLQQNLWGDELAPKSPQEALPITQAMDETRAIAQNATDLETADIARQTMDAQINLLRGEIEAPGPLKAAVMEAEVTTPRSPFSDPTIPKGKAGRDNMVVPRGQRGAINPIVFKEGFEKLKKLADGTWLRAYGDGQMLHVEARKDGHIVGQTTFDGKHVDRTKSDEKNLEALSTKVNPDHQGKGVATSMYQFATELGNDVRASSIQSPEGTAMWDSFERKGISKNGFIRSPGNKQMGAIRMGERRQRQIEKVAGKSNMIPPNPDPRQAVEEALAEGKDSNQWKYTESGASLAAMKRGSTAVLAASRIIQNAIKKADLAIRQTVFPVEKALRDLSKDELVNLASLMKQEMFAGRRFDGDILVRNLSTKEVEAYHHMRNMFDDTLRIQNEARAAKGQRPITEMEAYLSSRWDGDFRRPVFQAVLDKQGNPKIDAKGNIEKKLVWYLAAHSKTSLDAQWKALHKKFPDLAFDPKEDHTVRYYKRQTDLQSQFSTILDVLDPTEDHPAIQRIVKAIQEQAVGEGATFLGQEKHFEKKVGIRGFVGDRPEHKTLWGLMSKHGPKDEALAMFQQQIQYAKNAYKWSELQTAAQDLKHIVSDPRLQQQQPNNVKYIKEYYKNAVGYGEASAIAHLEDAIRDLHIPFNGKMSPTVFAKSLGNVKTLFILQKLGLSVGYTMANLVQTANALPHLALLRGQGYKGNPLTAVAVGIPAGLAMATGHYASFLNGGQGIPALSGAENWFWSKAFKYAEDNGVTARSVYDESPIESSFSTLGRVGNFMGKSMSIPETLVRSTAFATYVQMLKDSGKFGIGDEAKLFQKAEEQVNISMVDYRAQERPMMFAKLGMTGDFLNTLQTFPVNWYNQFNLMGRQATKGNFAPLVVMLAVQYAVAGAMGIPGFHDANELYEFVKDNLPAEYWNKAQENEFLANPKLWMVKNFGQPSVYGYLSDQTGLGMTSRVAAPGAGQMLQSPAGPISDIAKQVGNLGSAVMDPTNGNKWAQSAMSSVPTGLQGLLEQAPFMEGKTYEKRGDNLLTQRNTDIGAHQGIYERDPKEQVIRNFGLRSQREVLEREVGWNLNKTATTSREKSKGLVDSFYDAIKRGDKGRAMKLQEVHVKLTGNPITDEQVESQIKQNYMTSIERSSTAAKTVTNLREVARMQQLLKEIREESK